MTLQRLSRRGLLTAASAAALLGRTASAQVLASRVALMGAPPASSPFGKLPGVYNMTPANMAAFITACQTFNSGGGHPVIQVVGDSIDQGYTVDITGGKVNSWVAQSVSLLRVAGFPVQANSTLNFGGYGLESNAQIHAYDPNVTITGAGGWATLSNANDTSHNHESIGGGLLRASDLTSLLRFTNPENATDVSLIYPRGSGFGNLTYAIDGGTEVTALDESATAFGLYSAATSGLTVGSHKIEARATLFRGEFTYVQGVLWKNTAAPAFQLVNLGVSGSTTSDWVRTTGGAYDAGNNLTYLSPSLVILGGPANDWNTGVARATTVANYTTLINAWQAASASVIMRLPHPFETGTISQATQDNGRADLIALCISKNIPYIDTQYLATTWTAWNGLGYAAAGGTTGPGALHPSQSGYAAIAGLVAPAISACWKYAVGAASLAGAPTGLSVAAGNNSAVVTFTPPASNGGGRISTYLLTPRIGGVLQTGLAKYAPSSPATLTGLTNGTAYSGIDVQAVNKAGAGTAATTGAVTPAPGADAWDVASAGSNIVVGGTGNLVASGSGVGALMSVRSVNALDTSTMVNGDVKQFYLTYSGALSSADLQVGVVNSAAVVSGGTSYGLNLYLVGDRVAGNVVHAAAIDGSGTTYTPTYPGAGDAKTAYSGAGHTIYCRVTKDATNGLAVSWQVDAGGWSGYYLTPTTPDGILYAAASIGPTAGNVTFHPDTFG